MRLIFPDRRKAQFITVIAAALGWPLLAIMPSPANAQQIRCYPVAIELGINEIPGLFEAIYRPKGHLDVRCVNETTQRIALRVAVYDSMPQPHRLGKERSRDSILLWLYSDEARTAPIGTSPEKGLAFTIHLSAGQSGDIRFPVFPELHLPKVMPAGDFSHPMTLKVQWRIDSPIAAAFL